MEHQSIEEMMEELKEIERASMELDEKTMESMNDPYAHRLPGAPMNDTLA